MPVAQNPETVFLMKSLRVDVCSSMALLLSLKIEHRQSSPDV